MARLRTGGTRRRRWAAVVAVAGAGAAVLGACGPRRSEEAFCEQLHVVRDLDEVLAGGSGPRTSERAAQLQELRLVAPDAIEPHVGRLASVTDDLARTMGAMAEPDPDGAAKEVFARRRAELPEITAAGKAVEAYAAEHCQVELNPAASTPPTTAPPPPPATTTTTRPAPATRKPSTTAKTSRSTTTAKRSSTTRKSTTTSRARSGTTTTRRR